MHAAKLFATPHAGASEEIKNRWRAATQGASNAQNPPTTVDLANQQPVHTGFGSAEGAALHAPTAVDPQAPLIQALEGFEQQLAQDEMENGGAGEQTTIIALG